MDFSLSAEETKRKRARERSHKYRVLKKLRLLDDQVSERDCVHENQKLTEVETCASVEDNFSDGENPLEGNSDSNDINNSENLEESFMFMLNNNESDIESENSVESNDSSFHSENNLEFSNNTTDLSLKERLKIWALENITNITNKTISQLLRILKEEGHTDLPVRAETLLGTRHVRPTKTMMSQGGKNGTYAYCGIEEALKRRIDQNIYEGNAIEVLVNVDGVQIYKNSTQHFWPILIQIYHSNYYCPPAIVAIFTGNGKPASANEFFEDFNAEAKTLIENGITIGVRKYTFKIKGFVCDTPARAFLKCCKGHTGYYCCERCEVRGYTVAKNVRVFPETNCVLRTHNSFKRQKQKEHHLNEKSPLLKIPNFDIIKCMLLDYMHLLCLGVMKNLMTQWLGKKRTLAKLKATQREKLCQLMEAIEPMIPKEFQRRDYDIEYFSTWKATQFRFMVLYAGPIVLKFVLPERTYKHFMLFSTACRILSCKKNAVKHKEMARSFLIKFVELMPSIYGPCCQVINIHNLIHIPDDVDFMEAPLSAYSAFPFENYLGVIKALIRTPNNPLVQVLNRLEELDALPYKKIQLQKKIQLSCPSENMNNHFDEIKYNGFIISNSSPNNIVQLQDGTYMKIDEIYGPPTLHTGTGALHLRGCRIKLKESVFKYPVVSSFLGIIKLGKNVKETKSVNVDQIMHKVMVLNIEGIKIALNLLHE